MSTVHKPSERLMFGQFLIDKKKINRTILAHALKIQERERITKNTRMLGAILMNDFHVFQDRTELFRYLKEFEDYKTNMDVLYRDAQALSDKVEDLEAATTTSEDVVALLDLFLKELPSLSRKEVAVVISKMREVCLIVTGNSH